MMYCNIFRFSKHFVGLKLSTLCTNIVLNYTKNKHSINSTRPIFIGTIFITYSFSLFALKKNNEMPEQKLISTIKRSILCIQRQQYDKADQMLHLALRMAQDLQCKEGITHVYDIMANLAMEREQFQKAEKLFTDVMRRLLAEGLPEDNPKILHISSKLARIAQLQGEITKAKIGFTWTLSKIDDCKRRMPDNIDIKELWGLTRNWFGHLLMEENNFEEAIQCFKDAYDCFVQIHGLDNIDAVTILNNLSVACTNMEYFNEAKSHILKALDLMKNVSDGSLKGILLANLGLIYLREGLTQEAKNYCSEAWRSAKAYDNAAAIEQAQYCLNILKTFGRV